MKSIVISDRDGVEIFTVGEDDGFDQKDILSSVFSATSEQIAKLNFGKCKTTTAFYSNCIVVQINHNPLVINFFGTLDTNVGLIQDISSELCHLLEPLRVEVSKTIDL